MTKWTREEALANYLKDIEENRLPELRRSLAEWENPAYTFQRHNSDGTTTDLGPIMAENDRRVIATYEGIVERLREQLNL